MSRSIGYCEISRMSEKWSKALLRMMRHLNSFHYSIDSSKATCVLFFVAGHKVGVVTQKVAEDLKNYPGVFEFCKDPNIGPKEYIKLNDCYETYNERTNAIKDVLHDMVKRDVHVTLRGWRNEYYDVAESPTSPPLMKIERAAVTLFGFKAYGSHMNGYVKHPTKGLCLWIARRSKRKATFPGMLDNMVAGGRGTGVGICETIVKECQEEAGIPEDLAKQAIPVGIVSYVYEDERGIQPDVQYCFDLEVPHDFVPTAVDGEVEEFLLCTIDEVKQLIVDKNFKPNCAGVTLHFLMRKGFVNPDQVPDYIELNRLLHHPL